MKKIILSVAVATMALSTVASALEDIKTSGQAKLWYETSDANSYGAFSSKDGNLLDAAQSYGEVVFKLGVTGKQGNVGFGTTIYQTSTMGLEGTVVSNVRSNDEVNSAPFVGEAYITAPLIASTILKFGKQELNTPLAFTETWNAVPNTFNAAVLVNNSVDNLTLIGAYVGQSTGSTTTGNFDTGLGGSQFFGNGFAVAGLYKSDAFGANVWGYQVNNALSNGISWFADPGLGAFTGVSLNALWADASVKAGVVDLTAYAAYVTHDGDNAEETSAFALSAATKVSDVTLFAAGSTVSEGDLHVANYATGGKKSKLPTEAVYTDGLYVAQPGATAFKLKASGKLGTTGLALQGVMNDNSQTGWDSHETTEIDLIVSQKLGDFDLKGILMNRSFADDVTDDARGGNYVRVIASVNF